MKKATTLIAAILFISSVIYCQTRQITGKVIDKNFQPVWGVRIFTSDTTQLGISDSVGNFSINLPLSTNYLRFASVGFEWKYVRLQNNCNHIEVILSLQSSYDFISLEEVDRLRMKEFKKLLKLHAKGFENGVFSTKKPCYDDIFIPVSGGRD